MSDAPTFKVARVGQQRKRKGGMFSFLRGGGAGPRGAWSGATGGSGAASVGGGFSATALNGFGLTFGKTMLVIIATSVIGSGAIFGGMLSASKSHMAAPAKPALFSQEKVKLEGDTSNLPSNPNTIPNSMGFVTGSRDGLTPEERAQREADAAAAAEAQRLADEEAAKKAEAEQTAANAAPNPDELLASAKEDGKVAPGTAFGKKMGALSTSMGGGSALTGGAGMSGGVNRQFAPKTAPAIPKAAAGSITAMKGGARPTYAKAGNSKLAASKTKGFARRQLAHANAYSRRGAASGKGENAAADAGSAFDNNSGAGNIITGAGIGAGKGGNGGADATMNPNSGEGGPTGGDPTMDCGANNYQTADGGCAPIKETGGKDANPTLTLISNVVMAMLAMIGVIAAIAMASGPFGPWMIPVLIAMGAIIGLLGIAMMAMGDYVSGGIAVATGGAVAYMAAFALPSLTWTKGLIIGFGGPALMMVSKMLTGGGGKDKAPVAAQQ